MCKKVNQFDHDMNLIEQWPSIIEINRTLGYNRQYVSNACRNHKLYKNFYWKFNETSND